MKQRERLTSHFSCWPGIEGWRCADSKFSNSCNRSFARRSVSSSTHRSSKFACSTQFRSQLRSNERDRRSFDYESPFILTRSRPPAPSPPPPLSPRSTPPRRQASRPPSSSPWFAKPAKAWTLCCCAQTRSVNGVVSFPLDRPYLLNIFIVGE